MKSKRYRVFKRAIQILRRDGWTQKVFRNSKGQRCAMGAIHQANKELSFPKSGRYGPDHLNHSLIEFNDVVGRKVTEVYARLNKMAGAK